MDTLLPVLALAETVNLRAQLEQTKRALDNAKEDLARTQADLRDALARKDAAMQAVPSRVVTDAISAVLTHDYATPYERELILDWIDLVDMHYSKDT